MSTTKGPLTSLKKSFQVGVISDTHGLLRPEALAALQGSDLILHAGDIGDEGILIELETIAPVRAVFGNTDGFPLVGRLPERALITVPEAQIFMTHIGTSPKILLEEEPRLKACRAAVFGHTHQAKISWCDGLLFFNPGSAGPRRFRLPATVGILDISDRGDVTPRIITLEC